MPKYLVRLKPLDSFFFSGRETFMSFERENKEKTKYLVKSEYFPQQTTLLGVMRKQLLIVKDLYEENRENYGTNKHKLNKIIDLIGNGSFQIMGTENKESFGIIREISPLFFYNNGNYYMVGAFDIDLKFQISNEGRVYTNGIKRNFIPELIGYDPKKGYKKKIVSCNPYSEELLYDHEDIFEKDEKIGINTNSEEKGYYKQIYYNLKKNFEFSFTLELENEIIEFNNYRTCIYMGAESRPFEMKVEKVEDNIKIFDYNVGENRIVCIGDIIFPDDDEFNKIREKSLFILGETKYFRNYVYQYNGGSSKRSTPTYLLKRGSVIYVEDESNKKEIKQIIEKKNFKIIGYNHIL